MSRRYGAIAFTPSVVGVQVAGGRTSTSKSSEVRPNDAPGDPLTALERGYLAERDGLYVATVSETGWPYVQYRGGPPGFLRVVDDHTIGWADFGGNLQYVSAGNLTSDDRVALIVMDYAGQQRLKIFGHARVVDAEDDPALVTSLADAAYGSEPERAVVVTVVAYDWNCPRHIVPRYTADEVDRLVAPLRQALADCALENRELRHRRDVGQR